MATLLDLCAESSTRITHQADVIIYGGTSAAVTAGIEVARSGKKVIIVSSDIHIGGLSSGGLGFTDISDKQVIGGLAREFYHRIWAHLQKHVFPHKY